MMCYHRTIVKTAAFSSALLIGSTNAASQSRPGIKNLHSIVQDLNDTGSVQVPEILESQVGYTGGRQGQSGAAYIKTPYQVWDSDKKYESDEELAVMQQQLLLWANDFVLHIPTNKCVWCCQELTFMDYWKKLADDEKRELFHYCRMGLIGLNSNLLHANYDNDGDYLEDVRSNAMECIDISKRNWDKLNKRVEALRNADSCEQVRIMNGEIVDERNPRFQTWMRHLDFYNKYLIMQFKTVLFDHCENDFSMLDIKSGSNPRNIECGKLRKEVEKYIARMLKTYALKKE